MRRLTENGAATLAEIRGQVADVSGGAPPSDLLRMDGSSASDGAVREQLERQFEAHARRMSASVCKMTSRWTVPLQSSTAAPLTPEGRSSGATG